MNQQHKFFIYSMLLGVLTLFVYWPVGGHEFINYDDPKYVTENPHVQSGLTARTLQWAFATFHASNWHPLTWVSHALDCGFFGLRSGHHHLMNLAFHAVNVWLLFYFAFRLTGRITPAAFMVALFAIHPLNVESVAWIAERKNVLSTTFWLLTVISYLDYCRKKSVPRYLVVVVCLGAGLLSKPMLVTLPFVLLLLDYWPLRRVTIPLSNPKHAREVLLEKIPMLIIVIASSVVTVMAQKSGSAVGTVQDFPIESRIGNAVVSYAIYLWKMIWPSNLAVLYPHSARNLSWVQILPAILLLIGVSCIVLRRWKTQPYLVSGWLWYLGTLVPVIGLVQVGTQSHADRYVYVPLIGIFLVVVLWLDQVSGTSRRTKNLICATGLIVVLVFSVVSRRQILLWHDSITLFEHAVKVTRNNDVACNNLGKALTDVGRHSEAVVYLEDAVKISPHYAEAHNNLGIAYVGSGEIARGMEHYHHAIRLNSNLPSAYNNLGIACSMSGRIEEGIEHFHKTLSMSPGSVDARFNLGKAHLQSQQLDMAEREFHKVLEMRPDHAQACFNLGLVYAGKNEMENATKFFLRCIEIKPDFLSAMYNLALLSEAKGDLQNSAYYLRRILELQPNHQEAQLRLHKIQEVMEK